LKLMLDPIEFKSKPEHVWEISERICYFPVDISSENLEREILKGKTFVPCLLVKKNGKIKRKKEYWGSQEILCLDFDNEIYDKQTKKKKKHVTMTLEQAIEEFKDQALFIYKSFNYKDDHPKFRVVLRFNRIIDNVDEIERIFEYFKKKYPNTDTNCLERARMFFGGIESITLNHENRVNVDEILNIVENDAINPYIINKGGFCHYDRINIKEKGGYHNDQNPYTSSNIDKSTYLTTKQYKHIYNKTHMVNHIINQDIKTLRSIIMPKKHIVYTHEEVYDYLNQQDLSKLLGVSGNSFKCIFHDDHNPSAGIFINPENGHQIYKCFSEHCTFKAGTVVKCIEKILKTNRVKALRFLRKVYDVDYAETEWQKEQKEIIDENIRYIRSDYFPIEYPELYNLIKRYIGDLTLIYNIARENLPAEHYDDTQLENVFFSSMKHLAKLMGTKNVKGIVDKVALFTYLGLLLKLKENEIPKPLLEEAKRELMRNKEKYKRNMNLISFFSVPPVSEENFYFGEQKAIEWKQKGYTMKGISREMILRGHGQEEADRVYPQLAGKGLSESDHEKASKIEKVMMKLINKKGWITEKEVIDAIEDGSKEYKKVKLKRIIAEVVVKYDLVRVRLNKDLKEKYNIDVNGYPFVIMKNID
jgi:hypothetical protein